MTARVDEGNYSEETYPCDCGAENLTVQAYIGEDWVSKGNGKAEVYCSFGLTSVSVDDHVFNIFALRERLKMLWYIVRGKRYYFNDIILREPEIRAIADHFATIVKKIDAPVVKKPLLWSEALNQLSSEDSSVSERK